MSQFVERRVGDYLGRSVEPVGTAEQMQPNSKTEDPDVKLTPEQIFTF